MNDWSKLESLAERKIGGFFVCYAPVSRHLVNIDRKDCKRPKSDIHYITVFHQNPRRSKYLHIGIW